MLNKRKIEAEVTAEKKARLTHNYYRKQGINLSEVIDEVAANHEDLHEKATTIRLQLEEEQDKLLSRTRSRMSRSPSPSHVTKNEFIYEEDLKYDRSLPAARRLASTLEHQPSPSSSSKVKSRGLGRFVSPTKTKPKL